MKIKEKRTIPKREVESVVAIVCDLCGEKKKPPENWGRGAYVVEKTKISYESGEIYPEGGCTEVISYDICPECFMNKLVPWLQKNGATGSLEDRSY